MKRLLFVLALTAACGKSSSPAAPTPTPPPAATPTRVISLTGNLAFDPVQLGQSATRIMTIHNDGNGPMTVTGLQGTAGVTAVTVASWTSGAIAAGSAQDVTIKFTPAAPKVYSGVITVTADQTSGNNGINFSGIGSLDGLPLFTNSGSGNTVFDIPTYITRMHITGTYPGYSSNFIVTIAGRLIVNDLVGTGWSSTVSDGTYLLPNGGGVVSITSSQGVAWTFTEVR